MRFSSIVPVLALFILAGCDSDFSPDDTIDVSIQVTEATSDDTDGTAESLLPRFSGATFVAVGSDQANVESPSGIGSVSFGRDTVTRTQSEIVLVGSFVQSQSSVVEVGTYNDDFSDELVATFPDREVTFSSDAGNLVWDSVFYRRADGSQFNSQESLVDSLDGSIFITTEQFDITGGQDQSQALTNWSIRFEGDQAFWSERGGTVIIGAVSIVDDSSFKIEFANRETTVISLNRNNLVIDAVIYEKDLSSTPESSLPRFSGATFVAVGSDQANVESPSGIGSVSFGRDTVTRTQSEIVLVGSFVQSQSSVVEVGTYNDDFSDELVATFPDREVTFSSDAGNLVWDSVFYRRADGSQFNSQESLVDSLDGSIFITTEQFDITGGQDQSQALTNWSIRFEGDQAFWSERGGTVIIGAVSIVDDSSFKIEFANRETTVISLNRNNLVIDAVIYEKDLSNQFDSQETLVEFLDGASFMSTSLQSIGDSSSGTSELGFWFINFSGNTFNWSYLDIEEAGTVSFTETNRFSAELSDRVLLIEVEGDEFVWDGVRYRKVIGE